jgi:hypothetical protein
MRGGLIALSAAGALLISQAKAVEYLDARNQDEAYGEMYAYMVGAERSQSLCSEKFPDLAGNIAKDMARWQRTDAIVLAKTTAHTASLRKNFPQEFSTATRQITSGFEAAFKSLDDDKARNYCQSYFSELADGAWRTRTPKVYSFIEAAP